MNQRPSKRRVCQHCLYPQRVCVCEALGSVSSDIQLIILQHPSEAKHAKNTARLVQLCHANTRIVIGQQQEDFATLAEQCQQSPEDYWLVYPHDNSQPLESANNNCLKPPKGLILLDATWRKAYKMWQLNPWLHHLPSFHFLQPPYGIYAIRKTSVTGGLSTLEATAYAMETAFGSDVSAFYSALDAMQKHWQQFANKNKD